MNIDQFVNNLNEGVTDLTFLETFIEKLAYITMFRAQHGANDAFTPFIMENFDEIFCMSEEEKQRQIKAFLREHNIVRVKGYYS